MSTWLGFARAGLRIIFALLFVVGAAGQDAYRLVPYARAVQISADGASVYALQNYPQPGRPCSGQQVVRTDLRTGAELAFLCVPGGAADFAVDESGGVVISGLDAGEGGRTTLTTVRLAADGSVRWVARTGVGEYVFDTRTVLASDGSVFVAAGVTDRELPTTADAVQRRGLGPSSVYVFRLSGDGSRLLFATYLSATNSEWLLSDLKADGEGNVFLAGISRRVGALDFPVTPGSFSFGFPQAFVARFDTRQGGFRYIGQFGANLNGLGPRIAAGVGGRAAVASGTLAYGWFPVLPGAFDPNVGQAKAFLFGLNPAGTDFEFVTGLGGSVDSIGDLIRDETGNLIVSGWARRMPTTANARRLIPVADARTGFLMKVAADGTRVMYSARAGCENCLYGRAVRSGNTILLTAESARSFDAEVPLTTAAPTGGADRRWHFWASGDHVQTCTEYSMPPVLYWDTRDESVTAMEIRRDSATAPVVAQGLTGAVEVPAESATYFLRDVSGGPFGVAKVLGTVAVRRYRPLLCSDVPNSTVEMGIVPNPVLSCAEAPLSGTEAFVTSAEGSEIRVDSPDGPAFAARGPGGYVSGKTGDWVRTGTTFYATDAKGTALASRRAYLLPNRACSRADANVPMIRAVRDCAEGSRFTLAWWADEEFTQIREGSADGAVVASASPVLVDVTATKRTEYWLVAWREGVWVPLASTTADPAQQCEQGRR